jgi:hypothetical protein
MVDAGRSTSARFRGLRAAAAALLTVVLALLAAAPSAQAVDRREAAKKALAALGTETSDGAVVVFGLSRTLAPRTVIGQAGPSGRARAARGRTLFERVRSRRIVRAGARIHRADVLMRSGAERTWFFFEDRGPHQAFEHPGRVVLVGARTGAVRVSGPTRWVPLIGGRPPAFFRSARGYESKRYRIFTRPWPSPATSRARARQAAGDEVRQQVADALAAERSCALRISDTLGDFFDFGRVDQTRARLGHFFEGLEDLNAGFVSRRYTTKSGDSPVEVAQNLINDSGCRDLFLYTAGAAARTGEGAIVIGMRPARGGLLEWHVLTAQQLERLIQANPSVTFKLFIDAPYARPVSDAVRDEANTVLLVASGGPNEASFTYLPEVLGPNGLERPAGNPDQLLEFTNAMLAGLHAFVRDPGELANWLAMRASGGPSMMAWMMARALALSPAWIFAAPIELLKLPVAPGSNDGAGPGRPTAVNHAPIPTTPAQPTQEDTPRSITLTANDPDGDPLTFTVTDLPDHGTLTGTAPNLLYTPARDFNGNDAFTYEVADNRGASATQTVQVPVTPDNDAAAVVTSSGGAATSFVEDGPPVRVDENLTVSDPDSSQLEGATVAILGGFRSGEDSLLFSAQSGITGTYDTGTGVLTLTGTASVADYQAALRTVEFDSTDQNPTSGRTVEFRAEDGDEAGVPATRDVEFEPRNDAPVLGGAAGTTAYSEGEGERAVAPGLTVSDVDSPSLAGATVQITSNFASAEDALVFTNQSGITGSYDSGTGTLTLTGASSRANYETALRSVRYVNDSDDPSTATRTVSYQADDGAAADNLSNAVTRDVSVAPVNDAPVANGAGTLSYTENEAAKQITSTLVLSDVDDTNLELGRVAISANQEAGDDLSWTDNDGADGITLGSDNDTTDVLTLTGTGTVAQYQAALRAVRYSSSNDNPATGKTISFVAGDGTAESAPADVPVTVTRVNDAPTLDTTDAALAYEEGDGPVAVDGGITVTDPDSTQLAGATVQITSNFTQAEDALAFDDTATITGSYNDATGTLTLTGADTLANYQAALRAVKYENSADVPSTATRTVSFQVDDGGAVDNLSNVATRDVTVGPANDAPVVTTSAGSTSFTEGGGATAVDNALTVSDVDDTNLEAAVVRISSNFESGDQLTFVDQNGISGTYNTGTGVLTLTGTASEADYQTALRSITYDHTGDNPQTGKVVEFVANDGSEDSNAATKSINIAGVNDGPTMTTTGSALSYNEGDGAVPVDDGLTVSDPDSTQLSGATVQITSGFSSAADELAFADQNGITGSYDDSTGTLTLTGLSSVANYQTALRSVTYENVDENPSGSRTVSFQATDAEGAASNTATRTINFAAANDAPLVVTTVGNTSYTEGGSPATVDGLLTVVDVDDTNLESAQVRISDNFQSGDQLQFVDQNGISGTYNTGTGVLTLTGTASVANYQTALRSIQFTTTNDNPSASKTVEFKVNDGADDSNAATKNVAVTPTNDAPTVTTSGGTTAFTEDAGAVAVDPSLTVTDPDSANLQSATVQITGNFDSADDRLLFTDTAAITGSYDTATGTLTLTGADTVANYQAALRSVQYDNVDAVAPSTSTRTVSFEVTDSGALASNVATKDVSVASVNDAPVVTTTAGSTPYAENDPAVTVDSGVTVSDQDDANLEAGQVRISSGLQSGDQLVFVDQNGISGTYNTGTGVLTLTGTASVANYQTALRSIQFQSTNDSPVSSKTVEFRVGDGDVNSNTPTKEISVTSQPDPPVVTSGGTLAYTENDPATAVDSSITITDPEGDSLSGASASITSNYTAGQDFLDWSDNNAGDNITVDDVNSTDQTVVLTGLDSPANYEAALEAVTYQNTSENPATGSRTVTFSATDQPGQTGSDTRTISITAVDDPPTAVNDAATLLEDATATSVPVLTNDTDADAGPMTIASATDPANGTVVLTGGSPGAHTGLTYQPDPNYCNDPPGTTPDTFTYTLNGGSSATVSMTVTCVNDAPVADDETFNGNDSAHGNTTMQVDDPDDDKPAPSNPHTEVSGDILNGDTDVDGPGPLTVTPGTLATNDGGSVTIESDGDFTFHPAAATSCTDTSDFFDYTVEDSGSPEQTDTGRVTIAIAGCVWYVSNTAAGANSGTSQHPFATLAQAESASGANHTVFVFDGNNTSTGYGGDGYAMNSGERLIGEHEGLTVDPDQGGALTADTLHAASAGAHPTITATSADAVSLDDGNEIRGINVDPDGTGGGIVGASGDTGGGTIDDVNIIDDGTAATEAGLELASTTGTFNVSNLVVSNKATGVLLSNAGTVDFKGQSSQISLTSDGGPGLSALGTNMATSQFDDITVTNSGSGGVSLTNLTGSTTLGDGTGTDLAITTTSGATAGLFAANAGTLNVGTNGTDDIHATGGPAVDVNGTNGAVLELDDVDSTNSANDGINLDGLGAGTFSANASSTLAGAAGIAFDLNGGSGAVTFPGTITNGQGSTADVTGRSGGTVTLSGPITESGDSDGTAGEAGGITLSGNSGGQTVVSNATKTFNTAEDHAITMASSDGHTLTLSGGSLDIDTTAGKGLEADSSGTLNVTGSGNTIDTGSGRALNVTSTDVGSGSPLTFQRISSNGAASGIQLSNTGTNSALTVQGAGGTCQNGSTAGCSGGEIRNTTGADSTSTTPAGSGIVLNNTRGISLTRMYIHDHSNYGIRGTDVVGLTLADSVIGGTNGTTDATANKDGSAKFDNLTGTVSVTNSDISGGYTNNLNIANTSGTLNGTFSGIDFGSVSTTGGDDSMHVEGLGTADVNPTVQNSTFNSARGDIFQFLGNGSGGGDLVFTGNAITNTHPAIATGGGGVTLSGTAGNGPVTLSVQNNTMRDALTHALTIVKSTGGTAAMTGTIANNTIGVPAAANSGSFEGAGIEVTHFGGGNATFNITGNSIHQYNSFGMSLVAGAGVASSGQFNFNISGNTIANEGTNPNVTLFQGIGVNSGVTAGDAFATCVNFGANSIAGSGSDSIADSDFRIRARQNTTVRLPGYGGGATDGTAAATFVEGKIGGGAQGTAVAADSGTFTGTGTTCP